MKKLPVYLFTLLSCIFFFTFLSLNVSAQKTKERKQRTEATNVPAVVSEAFKKDYASATDVKWLNPLQHKREGSVYIVKCSSGGQKTTLRYSADAKILTRAVKLIPNDFPEPIQKTVKANAAGAQIKGGKRIERMVKNDIVYRVVTVSDAKRSVMTIDANGNLIKDKNKIRDIETEEKEIGED